MSRYMFGNGGDYGFDDYDLDYDDHIIEAKPIPYKGDNYQSTSSSDTDNSYTGPSYSASAGNVVNVSMDRFKEMLQTLKAQSHSMVRDLNSDLASKLITVITVIKSTRSEKRECLLKALEEVFGSVDINNIQPGTVLAKLFGCSFGACSNIPRGCNPYCAGSLNTDDDVQNCTSSVFIYNDGQLTSLHRGTMQASDAYIYVDSSFVRFNLSDIQQLRNSGIERILIVRYDGTTCTPLTTRGFVSINNLVRNGGSNNNNGNNSGSGSQSWFTQWWVWLIIIIIIIIIIGVIIYFVGRNRSSTTSKVYSSPRSSVTKSEVEVVRSQDLSARVPSYSRTTTTTTRSANVPSSYTRPMTTPPGTRSRPPPPGSYVGRTVSPRALSPETDIYI